MKNFWPLAAGLLALALPVAAADREYVACDNGLRCVMAPCPSTNVLDVASGETMRGIYPDLSELSAKERDRLESANGLYHGTIVVTGMIVDRETRFMGKPRTLPTLVLSGVVRKSTSGEERLCQRR